MASTQVRLFGLVADGLAFASIRQSFDSITDGFPLESLFRDSLWSDLSEHLTIYIVYDFVNSIIKEERKFFRRYLCLKQSLLILHLNRIKKVRITVKLLNNSYYKNNLFIRKMASQATSNDGSNKKNKENINNNNNKNGKTKNVRKRKRRVTNNGKGKSSSPKSPSSPSQRANAPKKRKIAKETNHNTSNDGNSSDSSMNNHPSSPSITPPPTCITYSKWCSPRIPPFQPLPPPLSPKPIPSSDLESDIGTTSVPNTKTIIPPTTTRSISPEPNGPSPNDLVIANYASPPSNDGRREYHAVPRRMYLPHLYQTFSAATSTDINGMYPTPEPDASGMTPVSDRGDSHGTEDVDVSLTFDKNKSKKKGRKGSKAKNTMQDNADDLTMISSAEIFDENWIRNFLTDTTKMSNIRPSVWHISEGAPDGVVMNLSKWDLFEFEKDGKSVQAFAFSYCDSRDELPGYCFRTKLVEFLTACARDGVKFVYADGPTFAGATYKMWNGLPNKGKLKPCLFGANAFYAIPKTVINKYKNAKCVTESTYVSHSYNNPPPLRIVRVSRYFGPELKELWAQAHAVLYKDSPALVVDNDNVQIHLTSSFLEMISAANRAPAPHHVFYKHNVTIYIDNIKRQKSFYLEERKAFKALRFNDADGYLPGNLAPSCGVRLIAAGYCIDVVLEGAILQIQPFYGNGALVTVKDYKKAYKANRAPARLYNYLWSPENKKSYDLIQNFSKTAWVGNDGATWTNLNKKVYAPKETYNDLALTDFVSQFVNKEKLMQPQMIWEDSVHVIAITGKSKVRTVDVDGKAKVFKVYPASDVKYEFDLIANESCDSLLNDLWNEQFDPTTILRIQSPDYIITNSDYGKFHVLLFSWKDASFGYPIMGTINLYSNVKKAQEVVDFNWFYTNDGEVFDELTKRFHKENDGNESDHKQVSEEQDEDVDMNKRGDVNMNNNVNLDINTDLNDVDLDINMDENDGDIDDIESENVPPNTASSDALPTIKSTIDIQSAKAKQQEQALATSLAQQGITLEDQLKHNNHNKGHQTDANNANNRINSNRNHNNENSSDEQGTGDNEQKTSDAEAASIEAAKEQMILQICPMGNTVLYQYYKNQAFEVVKRDYLQSIALAKAHPLSPIT